MFIAILALLSALSISGVAIYYSVIGLATIFPGAFWPVVIMGGVLEVGKLITASWLYRNWKQTNFLLKSYLFIAVIILSMITSMGIFGFLSKAHLESEFAAGSKSQQIEILNTQIKTEEAIVERQKEIISRSFGDNSSNSLRLKQLNERIKQLDKEVEAYTKQGSGLFRDNVKKGLQVKEGQRAERESIQKQIAEITNKGSQGTESAERKIAESQNKIMELIKKREPLLADQLKIEAEVGPIKYIAALAVDMGWAEKVDTSSAVRWVIIILIFVFDPLAVLLLVAANQSLIVRFPVQEQKPKAIIDLEKPDLDEPPVLHSQNVSAEKQPEPVKPADNSVKAVDPAKQAVQQWNSMIEQANEALKMEEQQRNKKFAETIEDWQSKLETFNQKVEKPQPKEVEIIPVPESKSISQQMDAVKDFPEEEKKDADDSWEQEIEYELGEVAKPEISISEEIQQQMKEEERVIPDFTEVIEPESKIQKKTKKPLQVANIVARKEPETTKIKISSDKERIGMLNKFHQEHGKFEDISDEELKKERDDSNKAKFLEHWSVTEEDQRNHPPITESRKSFFQDYIDDILRGNLEPDQVPEEIAKTIALLISDEFDGPPIVAPKGPGKPDVEVLTNQEFKEQLQPEPKTEDRDMTDDELDKILDGFETSEQEFDVVIRDGKKVKIPKLKYEQNAEQQNSNSWSKIIEAQEPEKNEVILPEITQTKDEIIEKLDDDLGLLQPKPTLSIDKIKSHKAKMLSNTEYSKMMDERITNLINQIDNGEKQLSDLTDEDQKAIIELLKD